VSVEVDTLETFSMAAVNSHAKAQIVSFIKADVLFAHWTCNTDNK
jgi:hypothetical protein